MSTGVLEVPVSTLVNGSVVWNRKSAGTLVIGAMPQLVAVCSSVLMIVANAVAVSPTCTERLLGRTAATSWIGNASS